MKTLNDFFAEAHSYGMEPPVDQYIKGLNSTHKRIQSDADALLKKHKVKGSFNKAEKKHGYHTYHGLGQYAGYRIQHYSSRSDNPEAASESEHGLHVWHGNNYIGNIKKKRDNYSADHKYSESRAGNHNTTPRFRHLKHAIKFLIVKHATK